MTTVDSRRQGEPRRKAMLVCPVCGHESPPGGDWRVTEDGRRTYDCPECGRTVVSQPRFEALA